VVMTITSTAPVYSSQARPWQSPPFSRSLPIAFAALFGVVLLRRRSLSGALGGALVLVASVVIFGVIGCGGGGKSTATPSPVLITPGTSGQFSFGVGAQGSDAGAIVQEGATVTATIQ
jgi:hypothetical protein